MAAVFLLIYRGVSELKNFELNKGAIPSQSLTTNSKRDSETEQT